MNGIIIGRTEGSSIVMTSNGNSMTWFIYKSQPVDQRR